MIRFGLVCMVAAVSVFPGARADCRFNDDFEIVNPTQAGCGDNFFTYTENESGADKIPLGYPVPRPVDSLTPVDGFRSYEFLHARHQDLMMTTDVLAGRVLGQTVAGNDIWVYRVGDADTTTRTGLPEPAMLFNGGAHAREWQSPEVVSDLLEHLVTHRTDNGLARYLLENTNVVVIPVLNVDGFIQTQRYPDRVTAHPAQPREGRMRRKNLRHPETYGPIDSDIQTVDDNFFGVDLNRNSDIGYGNPAERALRSAGLLTSLVYRGVFAGSEPEIRALRKAATLGPEHRLRLYEDAHSFTQVFFAPMTGNARRDRLTESLVKGMLAVTDNKYRYGPSSIAFAGGQTAAFFASRYQIPSWTLELEPLSGGTYGTGHGHSGFILPDSEIARVRDEVTRMHLLAIYRQAGPPAVRKIVIADTDSGATRFEAEWEPLGGARRLVVTQNRALEPGGNYRIWIGFNKPMRIRDNSGAVTAYDGHPVPTHPSVILETPENTSSSVRIPVPETAGQWLDSPGGAPNGYQHYADDAWTATFSVDGSVSVSEPSPLIVSVTARDLSRQRLDANPATVVDWQDGHWTGYEDKTGRSGDTGGTDCRATVFLSNDGSGEAPRSVGHCRGVVVADDDGGVIGSIGPAGFAVLLFLVFGMRIARERRRRQGR